jgi:hypothetical protein
VKEEPDSVQTISSQSTNVTSPSPGKTQGVLESQSTELESTSEPQWMGVEAESQCSVVEASPTRSAKRQQRGRQWRLQSKSVGKLDQKKESKAKLFMTWIKGASRDDLGFLLLNFDSSRSHLKVYNHDLKEVNDAPVDTPWPLIWMLVRCPRNYIWCSKKALELKLFHHLKLMNVFL